MGESIQLSNSPGWLFMLQYFHKSHNFLIIWPIVTSLISLPTFHNMVIKYISHSSPLISWNIFSNVHSPIFNKLCTVQLNIFCSHYMLYDVIHCRNYKYCSFPVEKKLVETHNSVSRKRIFKYYFTMYFFNIVPLLLFNEW